MLVAAVAPNTNPHKNKGQDSQSQSRRMEAESELTNLPVSRGRNAADTAAMLGSPCRSVAKWQARIGGHTTERRLVPGDEWLSAGPTGPVCVFVSRDPRSVLWDGVPRFCSFVPWLRPRDW